MTEKDTLWNRFIEEICDRDAETLSPIQKKAVLCFWYDAEMQNGGLTILSHRYATVLRNSYGQTRMLSLTKGL